MKKIINVFKKNIAFTLAEIVIVMGIVGVIGVLAITNAKKDTDVAEKVAQLRKTYQIVDAAFSTAVMENGTIDTWGTNGAYPTTAQVWDVIKNYLKFQKVCDTGSGCWKDGKPYGLSGNESNYNINTSNLYGKGILSNGVSISVASCEGENLTIPAGCIIDQTNSIQINVDVNGLKGLNIFGNDIFGFYIKPDGTTLPQKTIFTKPIVESTSTNLSCKQAGVYCTAWVLKFGNMDYLKPCADELDWNSKTTCK